MSLKQRCFNKHPLVLSVFNATHTCQLCSLQGVDFMACLRCDVRVCHVCIQKAMAYDIDTGLLLRLALIKRPIGAGKLIDVYLERPRSVRECYREPSLAAVYNVAQEYNHTKAYRQFLDQRLQGCYVDVDEAKRGLVSAERSLEFAIQTRAKFEMVAPDDPCEWSVSM